MIRLSAACATLLALLVLHALDHSLRQDAAVPGALSVVGLSGTVVAAVVLALALAGWSRASETAIALGAATVLGFAVAHLVPEWSAALSLPYEDLSVDAVSWASMLGSMAAAGWVAFEGVAALRRTRLTPRPR